MKLEELVVSRAHRNLGQLVNYHKVFSEDDLPSYLKELDLQEGEKIIGVYENFPGNINETIVVTNQGLRIFLNNEWIWVKYTEIDQVELPPNMGEAKLTLEELDIRLKSKQLVKLPARGEQDFIRGKQSYSRDTFSFLNFLIRIIVSINTGVLEDIFLPSSSKIISQSQDSTRP